MKKMKHKVWQAKNKPKNPLSTDKQFCWKNAITSISVQQMTTVCPLVISDKNVLLPVENADAD